MPLRRASRSRMPLARAAAAAALAVGAAAPGALRAQAAGGDAALVRALDLEGAGKYAESVPLFRRALAHDLAGALLGLERAFASLGRTDSLLPTLDSLVRARPDEPLVRTIQLRALHMAGADARARTAFDAWAAAAPRDPQPYRDYARLLLESGRTAAADTVLRRARQATGAGREFAYETAQLHAAQGMWEQSARDWRDAFAAADYLHQAATFALQPAAAGDRAAVRAVLLAPPIEMAARRTVAGLDLAWGAPADAWAALAGLPPSDSAVVDVWLAFADEAEARGATAAASQALVAAQRARPSGEIAARAAGALLGSGDAEGALAILDRASAAGDSTRRTLLPLRVRALSRLGRPADAERAVRDAMRVDATLAAPLQRELAWAWVRAGDLERARAALVGGGVEPDDELHGWLALYRGDLATARTTLRGRQEAPGADAVAALALLVRTTADSAPDAGAAFLALARGDSAQAAVRFAAAAERLPQAAPLLLGVAARLHAERGDADAAVALWERLVREHPAAGEAAEAELAWARLLGERGERAAAVERLEHMILAHPRSALLPQARRALAALRAPAEPQP